MARPRETLSPFQQQAKERSLRETRSLTLLMAGTAIASTAALIAFHPENLNAFSYLTSGVSLAEKAVDGGKIIGILALGILDFAGVLLGSVGAYQLNQIRLGVHPDLNMRFSHLTEAPSTPTKTVTQKQPKSPIGTSF